jgi:drug/metabolite transporter (DMT)-like permease
LSLNLQQWPLVLSKSPKTIAIPATQAENLQGSAFMVLAMAGFTINDIFVKFVGQSLELGQTLFIRGCFACIAIYIAAKFSGQLRPIKSMMTKPIILRSLGEMLATFTFVKALFHIPLANVSAIFQALPLALTLYAAFFMGEHVGWRRMLAILIGFAGVLIIIRPGTDGFDVYSIWVLVAVAASVLRDIATRSVAKSTPSLMIALFTAIGVTLMGAATAMFEPWRPVSGQSLGLLATTSVFLVVGYYGVVTAMRVGDIGFVSPFRYTVLLFSITGGALVFGEYPDTYTLIGAAFIVASGVYTIYRERFVRKQKIIQPPNR